MDERTPEKPDSPTPRPTPKPEARQSHADTPSSAPSGTPERVDRAAAAGLPSEFGPEVRVLRLRPAMFRARPFSFVALVLLMAAAGVVALYAAVSEKPLWPGDAFWLVVCLLVFLAAAVTMLVWFLKTMSACLEITTKRTTENHGLFSRATSEVLHDNIRNIAVKQSFVDRVFNVGVMEISSSGQSGIEITMKDVRDPHGVRETIDKYREL
ncbi:MAG: PH domain-containing protein [Phycisphaerales bacterium JB060]